MKGGIGWSLNILGVDGYQYSIVTNNQLYQLKMKKNLIRIIKGAYLNFSGSSGLSKFSDLLRICSMWSVFLFLFTQKSHWYNLTKFYINFSKQGHQIDLIWSRSTKMFRVHPIYTPFLIYLNSPFKLKYFFRSFPDLRLSGSNNIDNNKTVLRINKNGDHKNERKV